VSEGADLRIYLGECTTNSSLDSYRVAVLVYHCFSSDKNVLLVTSEINFPLV